MDCKNCDTTIITNQKFCSNCGEVIGAKRLKIKSILGIFFSNFFSVDNKFTNTFKNLTIKPEVIIDSYVNGYRKNYINVIGYLGLAVTLIGFQFLILRRFFPELLSITPTTNDVIIDNEALDFNSILDAYYQYQGVLTIVFIPLYAFASRLLFIDYKKYNLAEHFVINTYTIAHIFIFWFVLTLLTLPFNINYNLFSQFIIIPMIIYMTYAFKRLYSIGVFNALARTVLFYIITVIATIIFFTIIAVIYIIYLTSTGQLSPTQI